MSHENEIDEAAGNIAADKYGYDEMTATDVAEMNAEFCRLCILITEEDFVSGDLDTHEIEELMKRRR